jgi:histidinol phosphatase-like enzyme
VNKNIRAVICDLEHFPIGKVVSLPRDCKKPTPLVITRICEEQGVDIGSVAYVGDSMSKDILMARRSPINLF